MEKTRIVDKCSSFRGAFVDLRQGEVCFSVGRALFAIITGDDSLILRNENGMNKKMTMGSVSHCDLEEAYDYAVEASIDS